MSGDPLPLDIIGGLIAMRASVMTGVDIDEIRLEMGPGRILKTPAPNGGR